MASTETMYRHWDGMWTSLHKQHLIRGDGVQPFGELVSLYSASDRFYHTLDHIKHCLYEFEEVRHLFENPYCAEWELWYHDAIYNTRVRFNEELSAELAALVGGAIGLPPSYGKLHIPFTKHQAVPTTNDGMLFVDIDLSILGAPPAIFDKYEGDIRKEYAWVPGDVFRQKRSEILEGFRKRPNVYLTEHFRDKYEEQADRNLRRSIATLAA